MNHNISRAACLFVMALTFALGLNAAALAQLGEDQFNSLPDLPGEQQFARRADGPQIQNCKIQLVTDIRLPATETGLLLHLGVKEGSSVRSEEVIAQIDDRIAVQGHQVARYGKEAADARAEDEIEIRYSQAASLVAREDWKELLQANAAVSKAVTEADIRKAKLEFDRSKFGVEKAQKDKKLAALDARTKMAELDAAQIGIDQRKVLAPFDGQVVEIYRHQQEWVQAGDPILRLIRLDTLKVEGYIQFRDYAPSEIDGCEVTVEVQVGRGIVEKATGRVVYINPEAIKLSAQPSYKIQAEITNLQRDGRWVISPNLNATMTVHLGTGGVANARR